MGRILNPGALFLGSVLGMANQDLLKSRQNIADGVVCLRRIPGVPNKSDARVCRIRIFFNPNSAGIRSLLLAHFGNAEALIADDSEAL